MDPDFPHGAPAGVVGGSITFYRSMDPPNAITGHWGLRQALAALLAENYRLDDAQCAELLPPNPLAPRWAAGIEAFGGAAEVNRIANEVALHISPFLAELRVKLGLDASAA